MKIRPLAIEGAFEVIPVQHADARGAFLEWYRADQVAAAIGHPLSIAQANTSISAAGVVRGIHFADIPPGQAKYISCPSGAVWDVVVDIRVGSPTFGRWEAVRLDDVDRRGLYLAEGLGHGFCALTDNAVVSYLCSTLYNPSAEHTVHPLDPELGISWPIAAPTMSDRDAVAPSFAQARERGLLPDYEIWCEYTQSLRTE